MRLNDVADCICYKGGAECTYDDRGFSIQCPHCKLTIGTWMNPSYDVATVKNIWNYRAMIDPLTLHECSNCSGADHSGSSLFGCRGCAWGSSQTVVYGDGIFECRVSHYRERWVDELAKRACDEYREKAD